MIARPAAKFARPRIHVSLLAHKTYEPRNVCVIPARQVKDHRGLNVRDCKNHTHYAISKVKNSIADGEMTFLNKDGEPTPAQTKLATFTTNAARTWQKTRSGPVCTMQLKVGFKGRHVPAGQREPELVLE